MQKNSEQRQNRLYSLCLFLPAYIQRAEQHKTILKEEDRYFQTLAGSYNSLVVELRGVEPLSESALTGLSPGAVRFQAFPLCKDTGQTLQFSRVMMRGRGNSYPPHGRHLNDAFPGRWPFRFRRSLLKQRRQQC